MIDSTLLWIGVWVAIGAGSIATAARRFVASGERPLVLLAMAALALGRLFEHGETGGYFGHREAELLSWAALLVATGLLGLHLRERWRDWGDES